MDSSYYDAEAPAYDESRGGVARARDAAAAVTRVVDGRGVLLDVAGGTGIVAVELDRLGFSCVVADLSRGMLRVAAARLPGRLLVATADRLPVRDACVDVVTLIWVLHLLPRAVADGVLREAARVLRPGAALVTTVDKAQAHGRPGTEADAGERVLRVAGELGLRLDRETTFSGSSAFGSASDADPVFPLVSLVKTR